MRIPNLITGRSARLPGDWKQATEQDREAARRLQPWDYAPQDSPAVQAPPRSPGATLGANAAEIRLVLPWPPTINKYWRRHGQVIHVSTAGTRFSRLVGLAVRTQFDAAPIDTPVAVLIEAWGPREKWGDVDNREKPLLDALTKAGLWTDDKLVRDLRIVDRGRCAGGRVIVHVRPLKGNP